ncbi:ATP-binding protein [Actinomadura oligospora]|uniref:ATP-binding protein n=1 Tax=Actinomadura oligospora TaxID=111804 RepID=UPI0004ADBB8F|nr:ATP-binding protein [Actinomadura oligospora]
MIEPHTAVPPGADHLAGRLELLRERVRMLVEDRGSDDPTASDPFRGLYLAPETALRLAGGPPPASARDGEYDRAVHILDFSAGDTVLHRLAELFALDGLDLEILLIAAAPDIDRSFEQLYGYLNDDVSRRRATVGLTLDLCGLPAASAPARARFAAASPLVAQGLIVLDEDDRPFLGRSLRVPDRIVDHLLGGDALDSALLHAVTLGPPPADDTRPGTPRVATQRDARLLDTTPGDPLHRVPPDSDLLDGDLLDGAPLDGAPLDGAPLDGAPPDGASPDGEALSLARLLASGASPASVYLREARPGVGVAAGCRALGLAGLPVLRADPARLEAGLVPALVREARLRGAGIVVGPVPDGSLVRAFATAAAGARPVPVLLSGDRPYDPAWSDVQPLVLEVAARPAAGVWRAELARLGVDAAELGFDLAAATATFRFDAPQIRRAVRAALDHAALEDVPLAAVHLHRGARLQNATGLQKHARRISPAVGWDDLVLPDEQRDQLGELVTRARHRDRVLGEWRLRSGGGRGRGVVAMFAGESGTGKTMSSEVVAAELGLDLYVVELSAVVDKYVGETEKNLERIFTEADRLDAVLLFDEADAVFGKRSEVKDSHDRYANLESAYLLQRLESFDGIAILTTNLRANIDDAFTRRLDLVVDFPFPDPRRRRALWEHALAPPVPCGDDIDLARCAAEFELSGGAIRSAATTAAYLAAGAGRPVAMADVLAGARREYRKMGRLLPGTEF